MAIKSKSILKRQRQQERHYHRNQHYKSQMKTAIKKVLSATKKDEAESLYKEAISLIDRLVSKGITHKNTAARQKSKISHHLNSLP